MWKQIDISLLLKQPSDEGASGSLAKGWLLLVKALPLQPQRSVSFLSSNVTYGGNFGIDKVCKEGTPEEIQYVYQMNQ